jgi:peptidoglycan/xylan/chitin deacetylase (PgdA/CDA1 family)
LLDLFKRKGITTSFYIPGHTVDTFPEISKKVMDASHEIGHHGYYHEILPAIKRDTEKRLMDLAFASYKKHFGIRPTGYRAPYWEFSESTLDLVEEAGFFYDSSMMGRDLSPYRIQRWQVNWEKGSVAGPASKVLEIPVSWYLDDFPALANVGGVQEGLADTDVVFRRWRDIFDYAYERVDSPVYPMAVHPQIIGQAHHIMAYEKLVEHMMSKEGVWFATCQQIAEAWVDDEDDKRKMALPCQSASDRDPRSASNRDPFVLRFERLALASSRRLQREQPPGPHVFTSERGGPMTPKSFHTLIARLGERAGMPFPIHPHMLRHACGFALANAGHDTRALQAWLGHRNIQHTVRYAELAPDRFKDFWRS